jgi:hypothetical protein
MAYAIGSAKVAHALQLYRGEVRQTCETASELQAEFPCDRDFPSH